MKNLLARWGMPLGIFLMIVCTLYLAYQILQDSYTNATLVRAFIGGLIGLVIYIIGERARLTLPLDE